MNVVVVTTDPKTYHNLNVVIKPPCGEYRSRTDDLLRAKQAL